MIKKLLVAIGFLLTRGKGALLYRLLFLIVFVAPGLLLAFYSYANFYSESTQAILTEKKMLAALAASTVSERLNALVDLGVSFATRPRVIEEIEKGNWARAMQVLDSVPGTFPFIDRIVLFTPQAVIKADIPSVPSVIGQSRAHKEWYRGLQQTWQPYVSEVYQREAAPRMNVIAAVFPVRKTPDSGAAAIAILQLQFKLELFQEWIRATDVGEGGLVYIVDQRGRIVAHPQIDNLEVNIDYSSVPAVRKLLQGKGGAEFMYSPVEKEEQFAAFEPVKRFGWGVVVSQPAPSAFLARNATLRYLLAIYLLFVGLTAVTACLIMYAIIAARRSQEAQQRLAAIVESTADAIIGKDAGGRIVSWNSGAERIYGYTSAEAIGQPIFMLAAERLAESEMSAWLERLGRGEKIENYEAVRRRKDGSLIHVALTISPVRNELGQIEGSSTIARDITSRKRAEQEREELLASLQDALGNVKTLSGLLPICASCKKIRNDEGYWERIETYIREHSDATFSHGLCPDCAKKLYPQFYKD